MVPAYARAVGQKAVRRAARNRHRTRRARARRVVLSAAHLQRYRDVCAVPADAEVAAGLPVVAMPMHMQLFVVRFPVKVLGLIHLRNTIRVLHPVEQRAPLRLTVHFDTMRLTDFGQEYDFTTLRAERHGRLGRSEHDVRARQHGAEGRQQASRDRARECAGQRRIEERWM